MDNAISSSLQGSDDSDHCTVESPSAYNEIQYLFPWFRPCRDMHDLWIPGKKRWPRREELAERPGGSTYRRWVDEPNVFTYSQLLPDRSIRLIHLLPGQGDEPVSCSLVTANIDDGLQYEAVSYVWGERWDAAKLFLDGIPFKVTKNLYLALECIRSPTDEKVLWADAMCINQEDPAERSAQVRIMRDVYERAHRVLVWLGKEDYGDKLAMAFINHLAAKYSLPNTTQISDLRVLVESIPLSSLPDQTSREWEYLFRFFELPYFCRTWVIQEIQANNNCLVINGRSQTSFLAIELAALCAFRAPEAVRDLMITDRGISNAIYIRSLAAPNTSLMTRLEQTRGFFATDPRDKIFAFLRQEDALVPGYSKSLKDVLLSVVRQILQEDGLDGLSYIFHRSLYWLMKGTLFPSWLPTFSNCFIVPLCKIRGLRAGGLSTSQDFTVENEKLKVKAIFIDRIAIIHPSLSWDNLSVTPSLRYIPTYVDRLWYLYSGDAKAGAKYPVGSYSIQAAFSMAITAGLGRWGLKPDACAHERVFSEFTKLLFARAGDIKSRIHEERFPQNETLDSASEDLGDYEIKHINENGGGQASYEYEELQESNIRQRSKPMPAYQRFQRAAQSACNNRCVFETQRGYLGLGPSVMRPGFEVWWDEEQGVYPEAHTDESNIYEVWVPLGAKTPFVLQPRGSSYIIIGECYVQGFMEGEALLNGMCDVQEIELC